MITMSGQCHKYKEYETFPTQVKGLELRIFETIPPPEIPEWIMNAAPNTGARAANPGKLVAEVKARVENAIKPNPTTDSMELSLARSRNPPRIVLMAIYAPIPSSHALVNEEK